MTVNKESTRQALADALKVLAKNKKVVVLNADLAGSNKVAGFAKDYPNRFFQCGVAEQNMVGMACGFALSNKIPFVTSFAAFVPGRVLDQIRVSACYNNIPVKFASTHAGLTVGEDGATHQALEDIAFMRALPNMTVIVPCDYNEAKKALIESAKTPSPVYIRLGRPKLPIITKKTSSFKIGKADVLKRGSDVTIVACGIMVDVALKAAKYLAKKKISVEVINSHTIKPFDSATIIRSVKKTKCIVSAEEHQINGGLGSAVAECLAKLHPTPQEFVAVNDSFGESGLVNELLKKYKLTSTDIEKAVYHVLKRKK